MTATHDLQPVGRFSYEDHSIDARPGRWRRELRPVLRGYVGRALADDVLLAASEFVSNGIEHGGGVTRLRIVGAGGSVSVEVEDRLPVMVPRDAPRPERGRGLSIAEAVADAWGWYETTNGKVVWARFDRREPVTSTESHGRRAG
ncbi:MAG TPA: ATP-binding protein [Candidatus Nanopelagicales bacterium]|nr:ATP-binding protein [Candidatus Nanopelagicales bacterium]